MKVTSGSDYVDSKTNSAFERDVSTQAIAIAYQWLDAQKKASHHLIQELDLAYLASRWSDVKIVASDMETAARLHPQINGKYPFFTLESQLTLPSSERLVGLAPVNTHALSDDQIPKVYRFFERAAFSLNEENHVVKHFEATELPKPLDDDKDYCLTHDCECYYCVFGR